MHPIGGYFELECGNSPLYHEGVYVNSGRNALRLIIRSRGIHKLFIPEYTCSTVADAVKAENCLVETYAIDNRFLPARQFDANDYIVYTNYFGCCGKNVERITAHYPNLIVDNSQAFYAKPLGLASFYSPRKFFGIPDGGVAIGRGLSGSGLPIDESYDRLGHLLKRIDVGAESAYADFRENSIKLASAPISRMSKLTRALMGNIDYASAAEKRRASFAYLHSRLHSTFPFAMSEDDVPMVYPYITDDPSLRARLIENKIFVAKYWPGLTSAADELANRIIPLPIDQRYGEEDMQRILEVING